MMVKLLKSSSVSKWRLIKEKEDPQDKVDPLRHRVDPLVDLALKDNPAQRILMLAEDHLCKADLHNRDKVPHREILVALLNNVLMDLLQAPKTKDPLEEVVPQAVAHHQATTSLETHWQETEVDNELARHKKLRHAQKVQNTHSEDQDKILHRLS